MHASENKTTNSNYSGMAEQTPGTKQRKSDSPFYYIFEDEQAKATKRFVDTILSEHRLNFQFYLITDMRLFR